ncbi:hypothetical protein FRC08_002408 [Ceratobasidium sp. 394]|nr:hypothetical protein FRC08_002408 [Ceratobasidium sp. 394]
MALVNQQSATVYLRATSYELLAVVLDGNPRKMFTVTEREGGPVLAALGDNPNHPPNNADRIIQSDRVFPFRQEIGAPGNAEAFLLAGGLEPGESQVRIGTYPGQDTSIAVSAMSLSASAVYSVSNCSFFHLLGLFKQLADTCQHRKGNLE